MKVVAKRKMDLAQQENAPQIFCVQGDAFSRRVELELVADGAAWLVPEDVSVLITYYRPDGSCGTYTNMPDETPAWEISQNKITVDLTPQMLTVAGLVAVQLKLMAGEETISIFAFQVLVRPGLAPGDSPEHYSNWLSAYLPQASGTAPGQYLQITQVDEEGHVLALAGAELSAIHDHEERLGQLEERTKDVGEMDNRISALENTTGAIYQLGNRVTALEKSAVEIQQLGDRITDLEENAANTQQLTDRVAELEGNVENVADLSSRVAALEESAVPYPESWKIDIQDCIRIIRDHQEACGMEGYTFAYFSDHHNHSPYTGAVIAEVMEACGIPFAFFCGDMITDSPLDDPQAVNTQIQQFDTMMRPIPREMHYRALGEHDYCRTDSDGKLWSLRDSQIYNRFFKKQYLSGRCVPGGNGSYFYMDDPLNRMRFIVLNSVWMEQQLDADGSLLIEDGYGFGQEQMDWLINDALHFEDFDWHVIFFAHNALGDPENSDIRDGYLVKGILRAFLNNDVYHGYYEGANSVYIDADYQNDINANIIGWFSGHTHLDSIVTENFSTEASIPFSTVTIAAGSETGEDLDCVIDFVTIDKNDRTVYLTRLGSGQDRSFSY